MQPEPPFSDITIHLRRDTVAHIGISPVSTSAITVPLSSGVDLGLVGRVLGLEPNTLRLNGYFVSRSGPNYVSSGLLWGQLLGFFAQRGLPCGGSVRDAIVVQGKHMDSTGNGNSTSSDLKGGNPFMKRRFYLEIECPHKKRKAETNCKRKKCETIFTKRSLEFLVQIERHSQKRKLEEYDRPNGNSSTKRCLNSNDESITTKKLKIAYSLAGTQKSYTATTSHLRICFHLDSSVGFCRVSPLNYTITVSTSSSVDLSLVGRVLGLDPKTVRLNGYYVSRIAPQYVSPAFSWGLLLDFFAQKRLPCGSGIQDAIVVQGKYGGPAGSNADGSIFLKRKEGLETECPLKKRRSTNHIYNECVIHPMKRIINSAEIQDPLKRMKCSTGALKTDTNLHVPRVSKLSIIV